MLKRPAKPGDALENLPGARLLAEGDGAKAWLVPRKGAVCLVLDADGIQRSGCREKVFDVRTPLIVAIPSGTREVIAVAYTDSRRPLPAPPAGVQSVAADNGLLILDGRQARALKYHGTTQKLPGANAGYIGNAKAEWPTAIPAEEAPRRP